MKYFQSHPWHKLYGGSESHIPVRDFIFQEAEMLQMCGRFACTLQQLDIQIGQVSEQTA